MNGPIGLFDSGIGGLSILEGLIKEMPNEDYLFYEDSINNPYGEKDDEKLLEITSNIVEYLLKSGCKIIVIACNTATVSCMAKLRQIYKNVIFVGTVPAIKVAFDNNYKNIINLSTPYSQKSKRVIELINDYENKYQKVYNISGENLANLIENNDINQIRKFLNKLLLKYRNKADALILGCTHYSLIKDEFKKILPNTDLLDGVKGVAKEVRNQLEINNLLNLDQKLGKVTIINSKSEEIANKSYEMLKASVN